MNSGMSTLNMFITLKNNNTIISIFYSSGEDVI